MQAEKILHSRWLPWAIFIAGCVLFGMNLGARDFWTPDEGDFAQIVEEMKQRDDVLVPHLNGKPYSEKPPLFYWSILFFEQILGKPFEFSARLPSVLSAAGTLVLLFWLGKKLYGAKVGLLAAVILATTFRFLWNAAYLQTDMLFAFFCFWALYLFWRAQEKEKPRFLQELLPFYGALALGVMTKGPLAGVIVFLPVFALAIWDRDRELLRKLRLLWGLLFVGACTIWWYVVVGLEAGGGFLRGAIVREHLMRFLDSDSHNQPPHYYFVQVWSNLAPWSLWLPGALWFGWKQRTQRGARFFFLVFCATFLFLSVCSSKQGKYLLPVLPAAALLIAASLDRAPRVLLDVLGWIFVGIGAFGLFVTFSGWVPESVQTALAAYEFDRETIRKLSTILHGFAVLGFFSLWFRSREASMRIFLLAGAIVAVFLSFAHFYSRLNPLKSPRPLMERTAAWMGPEAKLAIHGSFRGGYAYYLGRTMEEFKNDGALEKLRQFLSDPQPRFALVLEENWPQIRETLGVEVWHWDQERFGSRRLALIANRVPQSR